MPQMEVPQQRLKHQLAEMQRELPVRPVVSSIESGLHICAIVFQSRYECCGRSCNELKKRWPVRLVVQSTVSGLHMCATVYDT